MIHYIGEEQSTRMIIAQTSCGLDWRVIPEFTSDPQYVTCKRCLKSLKA